MGLSDMFGKKKAAAPVESKPAEPTVEDTIFNMKFTAKQLSKLAQKATKQIEIEKKKCKEAITKGNADGARIHAENAIRNQTQAQSYLRLQSRIDAVSSKLEGHSKMMDMTGQMKGVTMALGQSLDTMNLEEISKTMGVFESQFEDLDMRATYMDGAIAETTAQSTPQDQVNLLLQQVGDEHNLDVSGMMGGSKAPNLATGTTVGSAEPSLEDRLAALKK
mmetsp:Transcript_23575/g.57594  ORF Transcript_23575/g.57594 Transcript_23575/m.57594 type:complete len:220 (+) Transcript_23575:159-818(+)